MIGIDAIRKWLVKSQTEISAADIIDYVLDFKEVKILGDEAIEWGRAELYSSPVCREAETAPTPPFRAEVRTDFTKVRVCSSELDFEVRTPVPQNW